MSKTVWRIRTVRLKGTHYGDVAASGDDLAEFQKKMTCEIACGSITCCRYDRYMYLGYHGDAVRWLAKLGLLSKWHASLGKVKPWAKGVD